MALFSIKYSSVVLNRYMGLNIILPDDDDDPVKRDKKGNYAVMYLLHGYTDDYTKWQRLTSIERYAKDHGIAVIMPDVGNSYYQDMVDGYPHFTHLTEEVPRQVNRWFKITTDPNYTYIAGNSMGGYGAMKVALTYPERYRYAATLSGALDVEQMRQIALMDDSPEWLKRLQIDLKLAFGDLDAVDGSDNDLLHLLEKNKEEHKDLPRLYVCCGSDDFLYQATVNFKTKMDELTIPYRYSEEAIDHNWGFWDREVVKFLDMICEDELLQ